MCCYVQWCRRWGLTFTDVLFLLLWKLIVSFSVTLEMTDSQAVYKKILSREMIVIRKIFVLRFVLRAWYQRQHFSVNKRSSAKDTHAFSIVLWICWSRQRRQRTRRIVTSDSTLVVDRSVGYRFARICQIWQWLGSWHGNARLWSCPICIEHPRSLSVGYPTLQATHILLTL